MFPSIVNRLPPLSAGSSFWVACQHFRCWVVRLLFQIRYLINLIHRKSVCNHSQFRFRLLHHSLVFRQTARLDCRVSSFWLRHRPFGFFTISEKNTFPCFRVQLSPFVFGNMGVCVTPKHLKVFSLELLLWDNDSSGKLQLVLPPPSNVWRDLHTKA